MEKSYLFCIKRPSAFTVCLYGFYRCAQFKRRNDQTVTRQHPQLLSAYKEIDQRLVGNQDRRENIVLTPHETETKLRSSWSLCPNECVQFYQKKGEGEPWGGHRLPCKAQVPPPFHSSCFLLGFLGFRDRLFALHSGQMGAFRWIC